MPSSIIEFVRENNGQGCCLAAQGSSARDTVRPCSALGALADQHCWFHPPWHPEERPAPVHSLNQWGPSAGTASCSPLKPEVNRAMRGKAVQIENRQEATFGESVWLQVTVLECAN